MSVRILTGDCREMLATLPDQSAHCCVTSPPYFGLRDYGVEGQMGLEATPDEFVAGMVAVFAEVRRVLRDDGTLWLNLGDSYSSSPPGNKGKGLERYKSSGLHGIKNSASEKYAETLDNSVSQKVDTSRLPGIKPKDLIGVPWLLAFALRADGWYLRQDIIWSKPNPMPESVRDRCTKAHEYLFLLSKGPRYFYDQDAILEGIADGTEARSQRGRSEGHKWADGGPGNQTIAKVPPSPGRVRGLPPRHAQYPESSDQSGLDLVGRGMGRNRRSVWTVATQPFSEAHFATFPPALIEPCILAGCPVGGTVLDPFGGAGTTGLVADRLQRNAVLIELNPEYAAIAQRRLTTDSPLFAEIAA